MPNVTVTVPEVYASVSRPVIMGVVRQLFQITGISTDTPLYFADDTEAVAQKGASLSDQADERNNTRTAFDTNVQISINEIYDVDMIMSTAVSQDDNVPVFFDPDIGVIVRPAYSSQLVSVSFKYVNKSKTEAERWRDDIRMKMSIHKDMNLHDVTYHYPIPEWVLSLLKDIHTKREAIAGYGEDFSTYIEKFGTSRLTVVANLSGEQTQLAVRENQTRIQGLYDFQVAPERGAREGNTGTWVTTFTYNFRYDKPLECNVKYPVMVHNQLLDARYIPAVESVNMDKVNKQYDKTLGALSYFEIQDALDKTTAPKAAVTIPAYDEFTPYSIVPKTRAFLNMLCFVDTATPRLIATLDDLGGYEIDQDILDFITKSEYPFLTKPYQSIIHASVYKGMSLYTHMDFTMSSPVNLSSLRDLDLRKNHRVRLSFVTDMASLSDGALKRLRTYPAAAIKIFNEVGINLTNLNQVRTRVDLSKFNDYVQQTGSSWDRMTPKLVFMRTVQNEQVTAYRTNNIQG
jgi:hypothetical protein